MYKILPPKPKNVAKAEVGSAGTWDYNWDKPVPYTKKTLSFEQDVFRPKKNDKGIFECKPDFV